ncbi:MAG TPA: poly-beta-1,6-N-acetyl-D-glucosamine biosynthesis protein PgaD [Burkholderiales bacterium]|nr:poly-beta-1,6-N-acetyl-D-glucosamine biosynthesis protein PgaD [Burkholderiales bacterium]
MSEYVIERPELQAPAMRAFFSMLTVVLWTSYVYLLLPVATLLAWYVGFTAVYEEMVMRRGWEALVDLIGFYGIIVLVMGLIQVGWASINWARFYGKRDRRRLRDRQVDMEIQRMFMMDTTEFPVWQNARRLVVHHHETEPRIVAVEATPSP